MKPDDPEEMAKGRQLLAAAIDLDEKGTKSAWREPGAKKRAADSYALAAEVWLSSRAFHIHDRFLAKTNVV